MFIWLIKLYTFHIRVCFGDMCYVLFISTFSITDNWQLPFIELYCTISYRTQNLCCSKWKLILVLDFVGVWVFFGFANTMFSMNRYPIAYILRIRCITQYLIHTVLIIILSSSRYSFTDMLATCETKLRARRYAL